MVQHVILKDWGNMQKKDWQKSGKENKKRDRSRKTAKVVQKEDENRANHQWNVRK